MSRTAPGNAWEDGRPTAPDGRGGGPSYPGRPGGPQHGLMVWYGQLVRPRGLAGRGLALLSAPTLWLTVFLALPLAGLMTMSLARRDPYGQVLWQFSLDNFRRLLGFTGTEWTADYLIILARSAWMASVTTLLCVALAYPMAFFIASRPPGRRYFWLTLVVIPLCTNLVIRTYAWMLLLASQMPPAQWAQWLGLIEPGTGLYPGRLAVYIGLVSSSLPFAVLPIYTSVERLDRSLLEAVRDLYGGRRMVFLHGILPQTLPGLLAGAILTFIPAMGAFVVPDLLGGARSWLVGNLIQQQFGPSRDWPFGAAVSLGLILVSLGGLLLLRRRGPEVAP